MLSSTALADEIEELESEKAEYDAQAQEAQRMSDQLWLEIESVSEVKRVLDQEAAEATADYEQKQATLDQTVARINENEKKFKAAERDYLKKQGVLSTRIRDIYINGQISYLDVLFGAKDFNDLFTRMDLLKRVVMQDYDLVQQVLAYQEQLKLIGEQLEADRKDQYDLARKAEYAKAVKDSKVARQQELIDRMQNDKAVYDRQYDEMMAASAHVAQLIEQSKFRAAAEAAARERAAAEARAREEEAARRAQMAQQQSNVTTPASIEYDDGVETYSPASSGGGMIWPISGPITSEFGWRTHPIFGSQRFHSGLDIGGDYGLPIHAALGGVVIESGWIGGYGNTIMIDHGGGVVTLYGHNESLAVGVGQTVSQGQVIAYCGSTGNSTGPHCHFEVRLNGEPVSPYNYL
ncbi:MAG: peptidoglycan DD-metalloendopeptidase family protein [Selenomonadaceae bacterium]|nr:peptidoglycan DD-metalloendopeptidase family protein [Selenomonadaceae bacterium]